MTGPHLQPHGFLKEADASAAEGVEQRAQRARLGEIHEDNNVGREARDAARAGLR